MRRLGFTILLACLLILAGAATLYWPKGKLDLGLYHAQKMYDLGEGQPGKALKTSVRLWNLGLKPVTIEEVSACCGSDAKLRGGAKKKSIRPLCSAVVDVEIFIPSEKGSSTKSIEINMSRGKEHSFDYLVFQYYSPGKAGA